MKRNLSCLFLALLSTALFSSGCLRSSVSTQEDIIRYRSLVQIGTQRSQVEAQLPKAVIRTDIPASSKRIVMYHLDKNFIMTLEFGPKPEEKVIRIITEEEENGS